MADAFLVRRGGSGGSSVSGYIFKDGDEYTHITGGWAKHSGFGSMTNNGSALVITQPASAYSNHQGMFRTVNPIDISSLKTLSITCDTIDAYVNNRLKLTVWTSDNQIAAQTSSARGNTSLSCDISALTGKHYIGFYLYNYWDGIDAATISTTIKTVKIT